MIEPSCDFVYPDEAEEASAIPEVPDPRELQARAIEFALSIMSISRTAKAGKIRLEAARWLICRHEHPENIAKRLKCTPQRFYQAVSEVKDHIGI